VKTSNKTKKSAFDKILVILCTVMVVVSCVITVVIINTDKPKTEPEPESVEVVIEDNVHIFVDIYAENKKTLTYTGDYLDNKSVKVYGVTENGARIQVTDWNQSLGPITQGNNEFELEYAGLKTTVKVYGVSLNSITSTNNYILYEYDSKEADKLLSDIREGEITYDEAFEGVIFCGDSRTLAMRSGNLLGKDKIIAKNGVGLDHLETYMQELLASNPETIVLNYGVNSLSTSATARAELVARYKGLLEEIKTALPNTRIIVAAVFPVTDEFIIEQPRMKYINDFNVELYKVCVTMGIEFIDGGHIVYEHPSVFNPDGLHFYEKFYSQYWFEELIKEVGVGVKASE